MKIIRGDILHFLRRPTSQTDSSAYQFFPDGILVIDGQGRVLYAGDASGFASFSDCSIHDWSGHLVVPGFIDSHVHYAQTDIIGCFGEQLLDWLNLYTFPEERRFADPDYSREVAEVFFSELLSNGTTTAGVYPTVHVASVESFFEAAQKRNMRVIAGKVLMDRNCPSWLADDPQQMEAQTRRLIEAWHGNGRALYALTPRFAPTSTPEQLAMVGQLYREYSGVYLQSHLAENDDEVKWVHELFPEARSYLDVYDRYGLLGERAIYAHCIHLDDQDWKRLAETKTAIAFSPSSNLFLGSGLFQYNKAREFGVKVAIATDVGAGTSFSVLKTLGDAYKVLQLQKLKLNPLEALYLATLGGAEALCLQDKIGNFAKGKEADFVVLDGGSSTLLKRRHERELTLAERLFSLMILAGDQVVAATYVAGEKAYEADAR